MNNLNFDAKADSYEENAFIQQDIISWGNEWLPHNEYDQEAFEFGSGTGLFTKHLIPKHYKLTASDRSSQMVRIGQIKYNEANWVLLDSWKANFPPVDRIYSSSLLQWAPVPSEILKQWASCLKPGGKMLHYFFIGPTLKEIYDLAPDWMPLSWYSEEDWISWFQDAGMRVDRSESLIKTYPFASTKDLLKTLHKTGATKPRTVSPSKLKQFIGMCDQQLKKDQKLDSTWHFFRIEVTKC